MKKYLFAIPCLLYILASGNSASAQGEFSGNFQSNTQFYVRDDKIGANTPQYLREKSSTDAWLYMNYKIAGFSLVARYDVFNNSALLNPQRAYTNSGIGYWSINKAVGNLDITAGYFYDQFGSGAVFRAFEDRLIGIDYAVRGVKLKYTFSDSWFIKAFTGQQKGFLAPDGTDTRFDVSPQVVKGVNTEKRLNLGPVTLDLGASAVNRTLDNNTVNRLVNEINALPIEQRFQPKSNVYLFNGYFTASYKNFSLQSEYNYKTEEALRDPLDQTRLFGADGHVFSTSLSYSRRGLGVNLQYKKVENFQFLNSPYSQLLNGWMTYLPSISRQNVYRLLARYTPVVQVLGENAIQGDVLWSPTKKLTLNFNFSYVQKPNAQPLYKEAYIDANYKINKKLKMTLGFQAIFYSQNIYQVNPNAPDVLSYTPFTEITYKLSRKQSIRLEAQYLDTKMDLGSFVNALVEFNIAPHWSFSAGDMVNTNPVRTPETPQEAISEDITHYYNFFVSYTHKTSRFTLNYLKQVQGVNCTGGICRVEPAFSGLRFGITTNF